MDPPWREGGEGRGGEGGGGSEGKEGQEVSEQLQGGVQRPSLVSHKPR